MALTFLLTTLLILLFCPVFKLFFASVFSYLGLVLLFFPLGFLGKYVLKGFHLS